jgi:hypothetical protein
MDFATENSILMVQSGWLGGCKINFGPYEH